MQTKAARIIGLVSILFFTFGITYLDFDDLSFSNNIRPYLMLALGVATMIYWLTIRSKPRSS